MRTTPAFMVCALPTVALSLLMAGCTTGTGVKLGDVVETRQELPPAPPSKLLETPPDVVFQTNFQNFFNLKPSAPTAPPPTPSSATTTPLP